MNFVIIPRGHVGSSITPERMEKYEKCKQYLKDYHYIQNPTQADVHKYLSCGGEITSPSVSEVFAILAGILLVCLVVGVIGGIIDKEKESAKS